MKKSSSPDTVQMSTAAAMTLGYFPGEFLRNAKLKALNLIVTYESGCRAKCAFCGLSGSRNVEEEEDKTFIRVDWPKFDLQETVNKAKEVPHMDRVCVSMITHEGAFEDMCTIMKKFKDETDLSISGLIGPTNISSKEMVQKIKDSGADMVGIAIDAVTPELFDKLRGKGVNGPHKWERYWDVLEWSVEVFGKGNVGVHLIVGIGETEKEMVQAIQKAYNMGADTHLFSFFPEAGSLLEDLPQPTYGHYRRMQLARYIINEGYGGIDRMTFAEDGKLTDLGLTDEELDAIIDNGEAFMTSGCPGHDGKVACNRPFGNERPSKPIRNYPFPPNEEDIRTVREQIWED
jgi:biotin synthase